MTDSTVVKKSTYIKEENKIKKCVILPSMGGKKEYPYFAYCLLLCEVPIGKVTRHEDIITCLGKAYGIYGLKVEDSITFTQDIINKAYPYWRKVSERGFLINSNYISRDFQMEMLESEGVEIESCRCDAKSYRVINPKDVLFNFDNLNITVMEKPEELMQRIINSAIK